MKILIEYSHNDCSNIYTKNIVLYQSDKLLKDKDYHIKDSKYKCNFKSDKKITSSIFS